MKNTKQRYVSGSYVPLFFWGTDFYPDDTAPDDTDLSDVTSPQIQFKNGESGTVVTVTGSVVNRTINGTSHQGVLISAADAASTLDTPSSRWYWRFKVDLTGGGENTANLSQWQQFVVYE
jgi:hypothetical protein